jgi:hypothetical protein
LPAAAGTALAFVAFVSSASAGSLSTANCPGQGVIVTANTIDWTDPVGPTDGCIATGIGTNVDYGTGVLGPAVFGRILDLPAGGPPILGFMTFPAPGAVPASIFFDLSLLGPGLTDTNCDAGVVGATCSAFAGSPFILTRTGSGTAADPFSSSVALNAQGDIRANGTTIGTWSGLFTTNLPGRDPNVVIANINANGSESSTHAGAFITTSAVVPEPGTITMSLIGGLLVAFAVKRKAQA